MSYKISPAGSDNNDPNQPEFIPYIDANNPDAENIPLGHANSTKLIIKKNQGGNATRQTLDTQNGLPTHKGPRTIYRKRPSNIEISTKGTTVANFKKLRLLLWKNLLLQKRHKWVTLLEILSPIAFALILVLVRSLVAVESHPAISYPPFDPISYGMIKPSFLGSLDEILDMLKDRKQTKNQTFAISPDNNLTRAVTMGAVNEILKSNRLWLQFLGVQFDSEPLIFESSEAMEEALIQPGAMDTIFVGIEFDDAMANATEWPKDVKFSLRFPAVMRTPMIEHPVRASWRTNLLFPLFPKPGPREPNDPYGGNMPGYYKEMFLPIQHALSIQLLKAVSRRDDVPKVYLQRLPQQAYREDDVLGALERFVSTIIVISFAYVAVNTVKVIAIEKELQLKETMRIMGLTSGLHWLAWFIKQYSYMLISVILMTIMLKTPLKAAADGNVYAILSFTRWSVVLFFFMLYIAATVTFCFMISVFFMKANTAASFMALLWFMTYSPYMLVQMIYENVPLSAKLVLCLFSNTALGFAFQFIVAGESRTGLEWSDFFKPVSYHDPLCPGHVMLMLILDTILYLLIALYVEQISPGAYGVPQPWYFPLSATYWRRDKRLAESDRITAASPLRRSSMLSHEVREAEPTDRLVGVRIKNLTKIYKGTKKSVDNLNLKLYENDITVLLGHNGAGKTTTMSMLTGMISPTTGTATISGHDIVRHTARARESIGFCPQHNVLFPDLTVAEHIYFYSVLKGVPRKRLKEEIDYYVDVLDLAKKRDTLSSQLSGGQKRRLSVGAAICGNSRVVLLDEPTSGLDPAARRKLWDLLLAEKKGRTMILSTHFMDEADTLADRVAIMAAGRLQCLGSPYFLKKAYGGGYKLVIVKSENCDVAKVTSVLRTHVPALRRNTNIGTELSFVLPSDTRPAFEGLLQELDGRSEELGVASYGLLVTSLEDVFMKAGAEDLEDQPRPRSKSAESAGSDASIGRFAEIVASGPVQSVKGVRLLFNHIKGMFLKLGYSSMRSYIQNLIQISMPIVNVILTMQIVRSWQFITTLPLLKLSLASGFEYSLVPMNGYVSSDDDNNLIRRTMAMYEDIIRNISNVVVKNLGGASLTDFYNNMSIHSPSNIRFDAIVGASFSPQNVTAWFSNYGYHDPAISLAHVNDATMRSLSNGSTLSIYNRPLPYTFIDQTTIMASGSSVGFQFAFNIGQCLSFVTAFIVLFVIKERVSGAKLLQRASGVQPAVMWTCALIWDWLWLVCISFLIVLLLAIYQEQTLATFPQLGRVFLVFIVFSYATVPVHYLFSFVFDAPSSGYAKMAFINIFTGSMPFLISEILGLPKLGNERAAEIVNALFSVLPTFCVSRCLKELSMAAFALSACDSLCHQYMHGMPDCTRTMVCHQFNLTVCCIDDDPFFLWKEPGIAKYLLMMVLTGTVAFAALLMKEYELFNKIYYVERPHPPLIPPQTEDADVRRERALVQSLSPDRYAQYSLVARDLTKFYGRFLAVDQLSFTVRDAECFGLLGVNGAGKTSTFKMLTGDIRISSGDAHLHGLSVKTQLHEVHRNIGYCPQFDALLDNLTGRETLRIFCLLRGIPTDVGAAISEELAGSLGMRRHLDKKVYQYSGGSKRKLSTAIALLGDASLIFLDEPTTGMDPASKRRVWSCLANAVRTGRSAVLTSHSMEECEALCSRLTVMAAGRMHCLGSLQHLKDKFSDGYTLTVKCAQAQSATEQQSNVREVHEYVTRTFASVRHVETHQNVVTYHIPRGEAWWRVFSLMQRAQTTLPIEDYTVAQSSLEQIFMNISRQHCGDSEESN